jgi:hypothetical protein
MMKNLLTTCAVAALLSCTPALAGEMVLGVEAGFAAFGNSGVSTVDKLERDEIATSTVKGVYLGYQENAWGGRWRVEGGVEHTGTNPTATSPGRPCRSRRPASSLVLRACRWWREWMPVGQQ